MGIELQGIPDGVEPGANAVFQFQNPVEAFVLGFWAFTLSFGPDEDHWINQISVRMLPGQNTPEALAQGYQVSAVVEATMQDSNGHQLSPSDSILYPICVAMTATDDPGTVMTNLTAISNGQSAGVSLPAPGSSFSVLQTCLAGFDLQYASGDNRLLGAQAGCGITYNGSQGSVTSNARCFDSHAHEVTTATVDAGVLGSVDSSPGFYLQEVTGQTTGTMPVSFPGLTSISNPMVLLRSWQVQYGDTNRNVRTLQAGSFGPFPSVVGNTVTLPNLYASVCDNNDHQQDDSLSSVTALVIALP